jgi:hypothetical protein
LRVFERAVVRRLGLVLGVVSVSSSLLLVDGAAAATSPTITASPSTVDRGAVLRIRGAGWVQNEFCRARVRLTLGRHRVLIGVAPLRPEDEGRFTFRWTVPPRTVAGLRTIHAAQRCESGQTGSVFFLRASTQVRVRRAETRRIARKRDRNLLAVLTAIKANPDRPGIRASAVLQAFRRRAGEWRSLGAALVGKRDGFFWDPLTGEGGVRGLRVNADTGRIGFRLLITPSIGYSQRYRFSVAGGRLHEI